MLKMPRSRPPLIPKPMLKVIIWVVVLLVLIVGGGLAYTWYTGKNQKFVESATSESTAKKPTMPKPTKPAANAAIGVAIHALTSPVLQGENASITVRTTTEAKCTIKVEYNKVKSTDSGLVDKIADEFGMVSWAWTVDSDAPDGKWPVDVNCYLGEKSAMVRGDLVVGEE